MDAVTVIIETPKGSAFKYTYEPDKHLFKLTKVLPAGMVFPFDFGLIPDTKGEDGDPLDIIVISEFQTFTGCSMDCRIIGGIKAEQTERDGKTVRNDRFIGIPIVSQLFAEINSTEDFPKKIMDQLEHFFKNYNEQSGKVFKPLGRMSPREAYELIQQGR
jgi:inorganic pyrophosphatase